MIIKFDKNLTTQKIYANGNELASIMGKDRDKNGNKIYTHPKNKKQLVTIIKKPILMTDIEKIAKLPPSKRDTIIQLLKSESITTKYNHTSLHFEQKKYPGLWGPNIDTLMMCRALEEVDMKNTKTVAEVGTGSGFIIKYVLEHNKNIKNAIAIDINKFSGDCIKDNIKDKRLAFYNTDARNIMVDLTLDTLICNPPYILRKNSVEDNAYEGLELFSYLIQESSKFMKENGQIISNISSISEKEAMKICKKHNVEVLYSMDVPLKVTNIYNNKKWLNFLLKNTGLREENKEGYPYWHTISAVRITK